MNRGDTSDFIPIDLIIPIFSRLPTKSIVRFYCVSKLWCSVFHRPYFTELFLTKSSARPRLLLAVRKEDQWSFYSTPQPHNPYEKSSSSSSLVLAADFHMKFPQGSTHISCTYDSGLIYFSETLISKDDDNLVPVIANPNTGHYAILSKLRSYRSLYTSLGSLYSFLGFDSIDKQFKVLVIAGPTCEVLTLGTGSIMTCPIDHEPYSQGICINGVLYYFFNCFDVRSEKFNFIEYRKYGWTSLLGFCDWFTKLVNYKGKLGGISCKRNDADSFDLHMLVFEDIEKQEFSEYVYTLPEKEVVDIFSLSVVGVPGEIVLKVENYYIYESDLFRVLYFNPESNTVQSVVIQGLDKDSSVYAFVDHVEDLNVNDAKLFKSSISSPSVNNKHSKDIITKRPKPQHREEVRERDSEKRYDDGVSREKRHRERNERDGREDEDRRRHHEEMRNRERYVESRRDRNDHWSDKRRDRDTMEDEDKRRSRSHEEVRDRERRVDSRREIETVGKRKT
ncbi:putative F-box protein At5g42430 [Eutrema salsugineum]|uniref:putative F-box protein At5g42430 n=1 Tax=Eutrema salsugineum TaxID=72664 RepID=UPI000CED13B9|nr:putative F-box protein At5g42430 [Eutrema salsugineum]